MAEKVDTRLEAKPRSHHKRRDNPEDRSVIGGVDASGTGNPGNGTGNETRPQEIDAPRETTPESVETVITVEQPPRRKRGPNKPKAVESSPEDLDKLVNLITDSLNAVAVAVTNERAAAMNESEQALFKPSLASTLKTVAPQVLEKVAQYSGPAGLITALGLWGLRLSQLKPTPKPQKAQPANDVQHPLEVPVPPHPGDGLGSLPPNVIGGTL